MQNNIRNTNLRFNLDKEQQRRAWEYLQTMDRQDFKSYSQVISLALVDYFDRYYRTQADPYLETREREELFVKQIVDAVENSLKQALPLFLSGLTAVILAPGCVNSEKDPDMDLNTLDMILKRADIPEAYRKLIVERHKKVWGEDYKKMLYIYLEQYYF